MFSQLYQESVDTGIIPNLGKENAVILMPKIPSSRELNHCRPVALISLPMKALERLVLTNLSPHIQEKLDPIQFAYKRERSTDDTVATLIHNVTKHLEKAGNYIHILFIDFRSAFNTIQRHKMIEQLLALQLPPNFINWMHNFISNRPHHVKAGSNISPNIITNTGVPQECVGSSIIYSMYTNNFRSECDSNVLIKYSDYAAIVA